jgi:predicted nucleic acid-binding protein
LKPLIFNSTPLIYLTKAGLSKVLEELKKEKVTSSVVKKEIVDKGKRKSIPDAFVLEKLFENGVFKICAPKDKIFVSRLMETRGLHVADAEVLALAKELRGTAVIDDEVARKTAKVYGINYVGTPYILLQSLRDGLVSKDEAKMALNEMISLGWRCSVETYVKISEAFERAQG